MNNTKAAWIMSAVIMLSLIIACVVALVISVTVPTLGEMTYKTIEATVFPSGVTMAVTAAGAGSSGASTYTARYNPEVFIAQTKSAIGSTGKIGYIWYHSGVSPLKTFVNTDGTISVYDAENSTVYEFSQNMELRSSLTLSKELPVAGAFTKDQEGNYYVFFAREVNEGAYNEKNMVLVKYSPSGAKQKEFWHEAQTTGEKWAKGYSGVMLPFHAGNCRLEVSGDMIAVYFSREQFKGPDGISHQATYGFILNIETFERLTVNSNAALSQANGSGSSSNGASGGGNSSKLLMPSVGHSFNQFILPINGGFVFADHADGEPRGFGFERVVKHQSNRIIDSFRLEGGDGDNSTGAEMGGLARTSSGYIFAGTFSHSRNWNGGPASRNLFVLTINEDFTSISNPIMITGYSDKYTHAASPNIVNIGNYEYLLMWEICNNDPDNFFIDRSKTMMTIVNEKGAIVKPPREVTGVPVNAYDTLRYSPATGLVYWAVSENDSEVSNGASNYQSSGISNNYSKNGGNAFRVYALNPRAELFTSPLNGGKTKTEDWEYSVVNGEAVIKKYLGKMVVVTVPDKIGNWMVTGIDRGAFTEHPGLVKVTLPLGIKKVDLGAFYNCSLLKQLEIMNANAEIVHDTSFANVFRLSLPKFAIISNSEKVERLATTYGISFTWGAASQQDPLYVTLDEPSLSLVPVPVPTPAPPEPPSVPAPAPIKTPQAPPPEQVPALAAVAAPTSSTVLVNGISVSFDAYNINGFNYFKLRDLAYVLNGTDKRFEVVWSGGKKSIDLISGKEYTVVGGEMVGKGAGNKEASLIDSDLYLDNKYVVLTAYNIEGNNYFRLRDIGAAFNFGVDWDGGEDTIRIATNKGYTEP